MVRSFKMQVRQAWVSKTLGQNLGHRLDFLRVSAYPLLRAKKK
ncbi:MAG: hypothetical protein EWM73_01596 [Nitrospira sp.]|nr:MAG: hypothetical protein EWM73_01596 [Nitrospira sp.]